MKETIIKIVEIILDFLCDITGTTDYLKAALGTSIFVIALITVYCLLIFEIKKYTVQRC